MDRIISMVMNMFIRKVMSKGSKRVLITHRVVA